MVRYEDLFYRPLTDRDEAGPKYGPSDVAFVRLRIDRREIHTLEIFIPAAVVGTAFSVGQLCEHVVVKRSDSPLRWYIIKAEHHGRFPPLKKYGEYFTFTKTTDERRMAKALAPFKPSPHFRVNVKVSVKEIENRPGEKVIALEMQEAMEKLWGQSRSALAAVVPVPTPQAIPMQTGTHVPAVAPVTPPQATVQPIPVVQAPLAHRQTEPQDVNTEAGDSGTEPGVDIEQTEDFDGESV